MSKRTKTNAATIKQPTPAEALASAQQYHRHAVSRAIESAFDGYTSTTALIREKLEEGIARGDAGSGMMVDDRLIELDARRTVHAEMSRFLWGATASGEAPAEAVRRLVEMMTEEVLQNACYGTSRSTSAAHNLREVATLSARANWLRDAQRSLAWADERMADARARMLAATVQQVAS